MDYISKAMLDGSLTRILVSEEAMDERMKHSDTETAEPLDVIMRLPRPSMKAIPGYIPIAYTENIQAT